MRRLVNLNETELFDITKIGFNNILGEIGVFSTTNTFKITPGVIHIQTGMLDRLFRNPDYITITCTDLVANTWYAIYIKPPISDFTILDTDIAYSITMPVKNISKQGFYHSVNSDWRCVSFFRTNAASHIMPFIHKSEYRLMEGGVPIWSWVAGNVNTWKSAHYAGPVLANTRINAITEIYAEAYNNIYEFSPFVGSPDDNYYREFSYIKSTNAYIVHQIYVLTSRDGNIMLGHPSKRFTSSVELAGFELPMGF